MTLAIKYNLKELTIMAKTKKDPKIYWNYVFRTTIKEIESYKELYGARYEGTVEQKILSARLAEAQEHLH